MAGDVAARCDCGCKRSATHVVCVPVVCVEAAPVRRVAWEWTATSRWCLPDEGWPVLTTRVYEDLSREDLTLMGLAAERACRWTFRKNLELAAVARLREEQAGEAA